MTQNITYKKLGGHVHCQMFSSHDGHNWAKNGDLVFDEKEWDLVRQRFLNAGITPVLEDKTYGEVYELLRRDAHDHDGGAGRGVDGGEPARKGVEMKLGSMQRDTSELFEQLVASLDERQTQLLAAELRDAKRRLAVQLQLVEDRLYTLRVVKMNAADKEKA